MIKRLLFIILPATLFFSSCATIIKGPRQDVYIETNPPGATVHINNQETRYITPCNVEITKNNKKTGSSTRKDIVYTLKKDGYGNVSISDHAKISGWVWGDLLLGIYGLPTDYFTASMYKYKENIYAELPEKGSQKAPPTIANNTTISEYNAAVAKTVKTIANKTMPTQTPAASAVTQSNKRELAWLEIQARQQNSSTVNNGGNTGSAIIGNTNQKFKKSEDNAAAEKIGYSRSSIYTLMIHDPTRPYSNVIKDAFGNFPEFGKFNDHNVGPYLIPSKAQSDYQTTIISNYLDNNDIPKQIVAKWFNRDSVGNFDMDLVHERGLYDANSEDLAIAEQTKRGASSLAEKGEGLIDNTFIIVNDYKYVSKEEISKKLNTGLDIASSIASAAGYDIDAYVSLAKAGSTIAGKGYVIKTTSHLYRLVWDEDIANDFYNEYWVDENMPDAAKVEAFNNSASFTLKYVGFGDAWADLQSSAFTKKSEEELIQIATIKATHKAIAKLQRKYEEFRIKVPLHSASPLTADIGLKEGLEKGDKYEVLEPTMDSNGKIYYKRKGTVKVIHNTIMDNRYTPSDYKIPPSRYTNFKTIGQGNFEKGMLLRQIN